MKYFKVFNTENEYLEYISSDKFIAPNISTLYDSTKTWIFTGGEVIRVIGVTLSESEIIVDKDETYQLVATVLPSGATEKSVTWSSSDDNVATVDSNGTVSGVSSGDAIITVTTVDGGFTAQCGVNVPDVIHVTGVTLSDASKEINKDETYTLTATVTPSDAVDKSVSWSSSNENVATVDSNGTVSGVASGNTIITVTTTDGGFTVQCSISVSEVVHVTGITLNKVSTQINKGVTEQLVAAVSPNDATDKSVTWSTSDSSIATVSDDGLVTAVSCGDADITVRTNDGGYTAKCETSVVNPVTSVTLDKNTIYIGTGSTYQLVATVSPSGACGDKSVSWSTDDSRVATVSNDGLVTAVASGSAVITVTTTVGSYTASCAVEVTDHDYSKDYLTFDILTSGTILWKAATTAVTKTISYSINDGEWTEITSTTEGVSINVNANDKVRFKGSNATYASSRNVASTFSGGTATYNLYGNIMSLIGGDDFSGLTSFNSNTWVFHALFNTSNVVSAKNLILPVTTLTNCCYRGMFSHAKRLVEAPELPATTLAASGYLYTFEDCVSLEEAPALPAASIPDGCYGGMFARCTSLTTAPELPAETLGKLCYYEMFRGCSGLTTAPELPAETLANNCYQNMFCGCRSLTTAPVLSATTLRNYCYMNMFQGCTSLTTAPELPASTLATQCYMGMFYGCTSLTAAPVLSATTLANNCYQDMFYGCRSLTTAPELPATSIAASAYTGMFRECVSLRTAPVLSATTLAADCYRGIFNACSALTTVQEVLPATILANGCYRDMFINCKSLTDSPILPAETLVTDCYRGMFTGCASLSAITALFLTEPGTSYTSSWVSGVTNNGTFYMNNKATWNPENNRGVNGIPTNWVVSTYGFGGLNIKAIDNVSVTFPFNVEYTNDGIGESWTALTANTPLSINSGDTIFFKSNATPTSSGIGTISVSGGRYSVGGKPISLIVGDSLVNSLQGYNYAFKDLFSGSTGLTDASFMLLPTTLSEGCYESMFEGCTSLSVCPTLSCNELTIGCYKHMFKDCTSIVIPPELPATALTSSCYDGMFYGCSSITDAPSLQAETLVSNCYNEMFYNCSSLSAITALFLTTPGTAYTNNWVHGVAASGDFVKNLQAEWDVTGDNGVPTGWESVTNFANMYFTIESLQDSNEITMQRSKTPNNPTLSLSYSLDNGKTWTTTTVSGTVKFATINTGDKIIFKGNNTKFASAWDTYNYFNATKQFKVYGNVMSLLNGDNFRENSEFANNSTHNFAGLLRTTYLVDASNLILPASTCNQDCYNGMFRGATALQHGPQMLATTVSGSGCCSSMFEECINLEEAIEINFTNLSVECCQRMFCMSRSARLTTPKMTKSPILRCTTAATNCYKEMFKGNGNLNEITCLLETPSNTENWVQNAGTATGTFYKNPSATWTQGGTGNVPSGWNIVDYVEE